MSGKLQLDYLVVTFSQPDDLISLSIQKQTERQISLHQPIPVYALISQGPAYPHFNKFLSHAHSVPTIQLLHPPHCLFDSSQAS